jgi:hypothetical protein
MSSPSIPDAGPRHSYRERWRAPDRNPRLELSNIVALLGILLSFNVALAVGAF